MENNASTAQIRHEEDKSYKIWAMVCHATGLAGWFFLPSLGNIVVPLIIWLLKKDAHPYIDEHGKEALNFQISITIYFWVSVLLGVFLLGFLLLPVLGLFVFIVSIIAIVRSIDGDAYTYPLTIRFIK